MGMPAESSLSNLIYPPQWNAGGIPPLESLYEVLGAGISLLYTETHGFFRTFIILMD
jgi:hypothetical protein